MKKRYYILNSANNNGIDLNELFLEKCNKYKSELIIFIYTFFLFFVIHLRVAIDQIHFADMFRYAQDNTFAQKDGRFFRGFLNVILTNLEYNYISYYFYFIISLIFISLSFVMLLKFFKIEKKIIWSIIVVSLSSTFECFSSIFCFIYDSPFYFLSFLLSNISLLIIKDNYYKFKNIILFLILNVISLFLYQSFYVYVSAMLIVYLIKNDSIDNVENKLLLKKTFNYGIILFLTFVVYYVLSEWFYTLLPEGRYVWGRGLPFQYVNFYKLLACYVKYFGLFLRNYRNINHTIIIKFVYFIVTFTIIFHFIKKLLINKKFISFILLIILPINVSIISFLAYIKPSMMFPNLSLYYLWILVLFDFFKNLRILNFKKRVFIIISMLSLVLLFSHNLYKTIGYYEYYLDIEKKNISFLNRLATKIELCEGYTIDSYVYINEHGNDNPRLKDKIAYNTIYYFENGMAGTTLQEIDWPYPSCGMRLLGHHAHALCESCSWSRGLFP